MPLSEAQKKHLRGLGHRLKPVVTVGDAGVSDALLSEFDATIAHHELIKVRVRADDRERRAAMIDELCRRGAAELVARIGNITLLYRRNPDRSRLPIPAK